jgi:hypothetical protein
MQVAPVRGRWALKPRGEVGRLTNAFAASSVVLRLLSAFFYDSRISVETSPIQVLLKHSLRARTEHTVRQPHPIKKLLKDAPTPLMPEAQDEAIKNIPRQPEVISLLKKTIGTGNLPPC